MPKLLKHLEKNKDSKNSKDALWSMFILHPEKIGDEVMKKNEDIKKAKQELDKIQNDEKEQYLAELRMKYVMDQKAVRDSGFEEGKIQGLADGRAEGLKEGFKEGIEQGIEQGIKQSQLKTSKKLLDMGLTIEQIIEITELTEEEIKELKELK